MEEGTKDAHGACGCEVDTTLTTATPPSLRLQVLSVDPPQHFQIA
jgi:hypothetical protein